MAALSLYVADRNTGVERLVRMAEFNQSLPATEKPVLLYSAQMFGSGKSTFGVKAISLLNDPAVQHTLLNPPTDTNVPLDLSTMRSKQHFSQELVDLYLNAKQFMWI